MGGQRLCIVAVTLCLLSSLWLVASPCQGAESSRQTGTLRIEGEGVQRLQLFDGEGKVHPVEPADGTVELAASTYTVTQIYLTNGMYSRAMKPTTVEVTAGAEAVLKVGGPLTQRIEAKRGGSMLRLSYSATGVGGSEYVGRMAGADAPGFDVYKGEKKIHHGEFEYG